MLFLKVSIIIEIFLQICPPKWLCNNCYDKTFPQLQWESTPIWMGIDMCWDIAKLVLAMTPTIYIRMLRGTSCISSFIYIVFSHMRHCFCSIFLIKKEFGVRNNAAKWYKRCNLQKKSYVLKHYTPGCFQNWNFIWVFYWRPGLPLCCHCYHL